MDCKTSFGGRHVLCCFCSSSRLVLVVDEPSSLKCSVKNVDDFDDEFDDDDRDTTRLLRRLPLAKCTPLVVVVVARVKRFREAMMCARVYVESSREKSTTR